MCPVFAPYLYLLVNKGALNAGLETLLTGVCGKAFGLELGYTHYNDVVYGFEESSTLWTGWDGSAPLQTTQEAFCGRHSLYVC